MEDHPENVGVPKNIIEKIKRPKPVVRNSFFGFYNKFFCISPLCVDILHSTAIELLLTSKTFFIWFLTSIKTVSKIKPAEKNTFSLRINC